MSLARRLHLAIFTSILFAGLPAIASDSSSWADRMTITGDFRYRHESIFEANKSDRHRHRIRARLAAQVKVNPRLDAFLRLASGRGEPTSTNQDLGTGSSAKPIWIDRAYVEFKGARGTSASAGKFAVPIERTEFIWDSDLNLEGAALRRNGPPDKRGWIASAGGFWLSESATAPDQGLLLAQAGYRLKASSNILMLAVAYADYQNLKGHAVIGAARGNTTVSSGTIALYATDYNLVQVNGQWTYARGASSVSASAEYVVNSSISENQSHRAGGFAGITFRKAERTFKWEAGYDFRRLARDAAVGEFSDSDFIGGGTNGQGHSVSFAVTPLTNTTLRIRDMIDTMDPFENGAKRSYNRLMADIEVKF